MNMKKKSLPIEIAVQFIPMEEDRDSLKAFKEYICNKYRVKSVDDVPLTSYEYADMMQMYEAGWQAREQKLVDELCDSVKRR